MLDLGIGRVFHFDLPGYFQEIAQGYQLSESELKSTPFWAVFFNGRMIAIYLDPKDALAHMMLIERNLEAGTEPRMQKLADLKPLSRKFEKRMSEIGNDPK